MQSSITNKSKRIHWKVQLVCIVQLCVKKCKISEWNPLNATEFIFEVFAAAAAVVDIIIVNIRSHTRLVEFSCTYEIQCKIWEMKLWTELRMVLEIVDLCILLGLSQTLSPTRTHTRDYHLLLLVVLDKLWNFIYKSLQSLGSEVFSCYGCLNKTIECARTPMYTVHPHTHISTNW